MASQTLEIFGATGDTLTISIAPYGSTAYTETAIALTEVVGLPGTYRGTSTSGGTGFYYGIDSNGTRHHFALANVVDTYFGSLNPLTPNLLNTTGVMPANVLQINSDVSAAVSAAKFWEGALLDSGTAQAGSATTITLQSGASAVDDFYKNAIVVLTGGTGVGQNRKITGYVGSTKVATISGDRNWATSPSSDTLYVILGDSN